MSAEKEQVREICVNKEHPKSEKEPISKKFKSEVELDSNDSVNHHHTASHNQTQATTTNSCGPRLNNCTNSSPPPLQTPPLSPSQIEDPTFNPNLMYLVKRSSTLHTPDLLAQLRPSSLHSEDSPHSEPQLFLSDSPAKQQQNSASPHHASHYKNNLNNQNKPTRLQFLPEDKPSQHPLGNHDGVVQRLFCEVETTDDPNPVAPTYGHLIVLGKTSYQFKSQTDIRARGQSNKTFCLTQRPTGNGLKQIDDERSVRLSPQAKQIPPEIRSQGSTHTMSLCYGSEERALIEFCADSDKDMFQFGRCDANDVVLTGLSTPKGPIMSRYAFRIECDRHTQQARIYGGGFDEENHLFLGSNSIIWNTHNIFDGFTTNGVRVFHFPGADLRDETHTVANQLDNDKTWAQDNWAEISCRGYAYQIRSPENYQQQPQPHLRATNVLRDSTLINIGGLTLLWRTGPIDRSQGLSQSVLTQELQNALARTGPFSTVDSPHSHTTAASNMNSLDDSFGSGFLNHPQSMSSQSAHASASMFDTQNQFQNFSLPNLNSILAPPDVDSQNSQDFKKLKDNSNSHSPQKSHGSHHQHHTDPFRVPTQPQTQLLPTACLSCESLQPAAPSSLKNCLHCKKEKSLLALRIEPSASLSLFCKSKPNCAFNPCGHMADEWAVRVWARVTQPAIQEISQLPVRHCCPFCRGTLSSSRPFVKIKQLQ